MDQSKMTFAMVKNIEQEITKGDSFISSLITFRKIKEYLRIAGYNIAIGRNYKTKKQDVEFASALGISVPKTLQSSCSFDEIIIQPNTVIKPARGSSSLVCFYVDQNLIIHSIRSGSKYSGLPDCLQEIKKYKSRISYDSWQVEQLIAKNGIPAHDMKVYFFYGVPAFYLQIDRNAKPVNYCLYDASRKYLDSTSEPSFYLSPTQVFKGEGVPDEVIELGKIISLNTPAPFVRVDFLLGDEKVFLGEITPNPGSYYGTYSDQLDNLLGTHFNKAWSRLLADLLEGKKFDLYHQVYGGQKKSIKNRSLPLDFISRLSDSSRSFKKKSTRHHLKSQGLIYSSFSVCGYCVPRELAQRDAKTRIDQFGLKPSEWEGKKVLDLGCNNGALLFQLTNLGISSGLGIEYDADKVAVAQEISNFVGIDHLHFQQGDIDTLDADTLDTFDVVLALAIEAHVNDPDKLFTLLGKITRQVLCFEGNSRCDVEHTRQRLLQLGFTQVEYKGFCTDDVLPANNTRPVFIARKAN